MTYFLARIYFKVHHNERRSAQWRFENQDSDRANWRRSPSSAEDMISRTVALEENLKGLEQLDAPEQSPSGGSQSTQDPRTETNKSNSTEDCVEQHPCTDMGRESIGRSSHRHRQRHKRSELEKKVFWQGLSYFAAFMLAWPFPIAFAYVQAITYYTNIYTVIVFAFISPLQGFANAMVYFRPRLHHSKLCGGNSRQLIESGRLSTPNVSTATHHQQI